MTLEQVLAAQGLATMHASILARHLLTPLAKTSSSYFAGLIAWEVEVLRLVAQGLTDTQIAEWLAISPRTVNGHLISIYSKLQLSWRSDTTCYAL